MLNPQPHSTFILHPSSFILHPSSFILHPSSFILHPSSFILHPSSFIIHPSSFPYRLLHHLLINRHHSPALGRIVSEVADDAAARLAQRARAEALLPRGAPGAGDDRAARA